MTAPVILSAEDHAILVQKARAWDDHVMRRMMEGFTRAECEVMLLSKHNAVLLEITDPIIITPYGQALVHMHDGKRREILLNQNDRVRLNHEVKLTIS